MKKKGGNVAFVIQVTNATSTSSLEQSIGAWQFCSFSFLFLYKTSEFHFAVSLFSKE